jgi:hypothetical protein
MPLVRNRRRRVGRPRRRQGAGFLDALRSAHDFIKRNKIISTVSGALSKVGIPYAGAINTASTALGYGRRRRVVRRKRGGNLRSILGRVHQFVKSNQLVSKGLSAAGHSKLASAASSLGYGRRPRRLSDIVAVLIFSQPNSWRDRGSNFI